MPLIPNQVLPTSAGSRRYHVWVPAAPGPAPLPTIFIFHGGGQSARSIAARWGVLAGMPPAAVNQYLPNHILVFPEAHPRGAGAWVHWKENFKEFPTLDLDFVQALVGAAVGGGFPFVTADPNFLYAAGFSNGAGMVWQLMNSNLVSLFQGFAAVGMPLDPEKETRYADQLLAMALPPPAPVPTIYIHGTADETFRPTMLQHEPELNHTLPYETVRKMLARNWLGPGPANTWLLPGSVNRTEVVLQLFPAVLPGAASFGMATVINGGHNWPNTGAGGPVFGPVALHFDATQTIVGFWMTQAGLPP